MSDNNRYSHDHETLSSRNRIDEICDEFEQRYAAHERPEIRTYMARAMPSDRAALFRELLLIDVHFCRSRGASPDWDRLASEFPPYIDELESVRLQVSALQDTSKRALPSPDKLQPGGRVGRFELLEQVGSGAVGEVWKARDTRLQRYVALKFPRSIRLTEAESLRFLREGNSAARLRHPHVVAVHEIDYDGEFLFIVTDFVEGRNLREHLDSFPVAFDEAARLCASLADALDAAHRLGIVHRDLKPANVLLDADNQPHLTDFGLAKLSDDSSEMTMSGELLGTPAYMSPEQAAGRTEEVSALSDIYSLGVILYELLCGRRPHVGDRAAVISKILTESPRAPRQTVRDVPRDLEAICLKAIEKLPADRYQSAQEMGDDLRRFLQGETVVANRRSSLYRFWRMLKRQRVRAALVLLCVAALASLAVAARYARMTSELLGLRDVSITTSPPGASVTFLPLDVSSAEPRLDKAIEVAGLTPTEARMSPGDYMVVAVLEDGRFHEVLRHVPQKDELLSGSFKHNRWREQANGGIALPEIVIPDPDVTAGMARVEGGGFRAARKGLLDESTVQLETFYVDPREYTVRQYMTVKPAAKLRDRRSKADEPEAAVNVSYDEALSIAEALGKRLLTAKEFEFVATARGTTRFPWGDTPPEALDRGALATAADS